MEDKKNASEAKKKSPIQATIEIIAPKGSESPPDGTYLKWFETAVSFVKVVAWPLIGLFLFFQLQQPIIATFAQLPTVVSQAIKISVGNLSFEIQKTALDAGDQELAELMGGLSPQSIEILLEVGTAYYDLVGTIFDDSGCFTFPNQSDMSTLIELEDKGLLKFRISRNEYDDFIKSLNLTQDTDIKKDRLVFCSTRPLTLDEINKLKEQQYYLTELGRRAFNLVVAVVVRQLQTPIPVKSIPQQ